jgi:putative radical SAM enzyme (TIGR03279 family)
MSIRITTIEPGSIAEELGIQPGDELVTMNGEPIHDELDVKFYMPGEMVEIELYLQGQFTQIEIEKEHDDEIGFVVEPMKMTACGNDCVFCFVDQNPAGMRKAMYFRDGDYRFSHLYGNFNTMTNVGPTGLQRIVKQRLMPQYVSVHSTDLAVRTRLMRLRKDDHILDKLRYLAENDIWMHTQIVLCPGINDGESLLKTIDDIYGLGPSVQTMAIVPVGLTSHRDNLVDLKQVDKAYARKMIELIFDLQKKFRRERGVNWVYLSDEWFLVAAMETPPEEWYDGFPQLENGVGMVRDFIEETKKEVKSLISRGAGWIASQRTLTLATSTLSSVFMKQNIAPVLEQIPNLSVDLQVVTNQLYGPDVTVTGLLSGRCFYHHFHDKQATDLLLLPPNVLNEDDVFLDDESPLQLKTRLNNRPMAIFHGSWEEVLYYLDHPEAETFDTKKLKLTVL